MLDHAPGREPVAATTRHTPPPVNSYQGEKCALLFAQRPKNGSWSQPETVDTCNSSGYRNLAIHVRKDGTADIVAAGEFGNIEVYRRQNPIDPWSKTMLTSVTGQGRPSFVAAHGADGTTHLVTQPYYFTTSSSNGDSTGTYVELGDDGPVRSVPLTTHRQQYRAPFLDLDVDGAGNVWIQKRPHESRERPSVLRIDRSGNLVERSLGLVSTGPWLHSSLAVSKAGEIALVHVGDNRNVSVRRFTPVAR